MWPFTKSRQFPGVRENPDGTIEFELTEEEVREADRAFALFKGRVVHGDAAELIRNGTIAVTLSRYAKDLMSLNGDGGTDSDGMAHLPEVSARIEKAVAAMWKAYSLNPMPVYLYHRACYLKMLGMGRESQHLFEMFLKQQPEFKTDEISQLLVNYEGTNIEMALADARGET
jgi:hypothetical protein